MGDPSLCVINHKHVVQNDFQSDMKNVITFGTNLWIITFHIEDEASWHEAHFCARLIGQQRDRVIISPVEGQLIVR